MKIIKGILLTFCGYFAFLPISATEQETFLNKLVKAVSTATVQAGNYKGNLEIKQSDNMTVLSSVSKNAEKDLYFYYTYLPFYKTLYITIYDPTVRFGAVTNATLDLKNLSGKAVEFDNVQVCSTVSDDLALKLGIAIARGLGAKTLTSKVGNPEQIPNRVTSFKAQGFKGSPSDLVLDL